MLEFYVWSLDCQLSASCRKKKDFVVLCSVTVMEVSLSWQVFSQVMISLFPTTHSHAHNQSLRSMLCH